MIIKHNPKKRFKNFFAALASKNAQTPIWPQKNSFFKKYSKAIFKTNKKYLNFYDFLHFFQFFKSTKISIKILCLWHLQ